MRVLHVYKTFYPDSQGGAEEVIRQLSKGCIAEGIEVRVLVASSSVTKVTTSDFEGIEIIQCPSIFEFASTPFFFKGIGEFKKQAAWADILHYHHPYPFADCLHWLLPADIRAKTKIVVSYHSDIVKQQKLLAIYRPLMNWFLNKADAIIAATPTYAASSQTLQSYEHKTHIIPYGLDEASLPQLDKDNMAGWKNKVGDGFFLFIGVFRYYKGLKYLLEAAKGQDFNVIIAGDGPELKNLLEYQKQNNIDNVVFIHDVDDTDKVSLLNLCKALVLPSHLRSEAFGLVLLEAMMFKRPLVCCKLGSGMEYINLDGVTGYLAKPDDATTLRDAITSLQTNPDTARAMGIAARQRYEDLFGHKKMMGEMMTLYYDLIKAPTASR